MTTATTARRMFELLEPICLVTFVADECNEEMAALGHRDAGGHGIAMTNSDRCADWSMWPCPTRPDTSPAGGSRA